MSAVKTVNIIGMGYGGYGAPVGDGERWTLNTGYIYENIDRLFLMHNEKINKAINRQPDGSVFDMIAYLKKQPDMRVFGIYPHNIEDIGGVYPHFRAHEAAVGGELVRTVEKYPIEKVARMLGGMFFPYSVCLMMALAIYEGFSRIRLCGFEIFSYPQNQSYEGQAEAVIAMERFARGRGIGVDIDFMSILQMRQKNTMYGYFE
jgi:hypothetical protein